MKKTSSTKQYIQHLLKNVPQTPGVYRMLDNKEKIIYIGKAKNLRNRLRSYFRKNQEHSIKTKKMLEKVADFKYSITTTELEALILETNLIKEFRPKYNVLMKDDKNFAYIKVTVKEDYPRILIVRKIINDKALYFGPKTTASKFYNTLHLLRKTFPYRNCGLNIKDLGESDKNRPNCNRKVLITHAGIKYPCLDMHIKRCLAPCIGQPTLEEYRNIIDKIIKFLEGRYETIIDELKEQMLLAASEKMFEKAAQLRDKIELIEKLFEFQAINTTDHAHSDVINFWRQEGKAYFNIFQIRDGKLIDQQNLILDDHDNGSEDTEILTAFVQNFYSNNSNIPNEILLPVQTTDNETIEKWLQNNCKHQVKLHFPQKGKKEKLLEMSLENAASYAKQFQAKWEANSIQNREEGLKTLAKILKLKKPPKRIECYDISHLSGTHTVASMVVFEKGFPKRDQYRHFKISLETPGKPDDFIAMQEVLLRRLKYLRPISFRRKGDTLIYKLQTKTQNSSKNSAKTPTKHSEKNKLQQIKILSENKFKTFLAPFDIQKISDEHLILSISAKINSRRIYFCFKKTQTERFENLGLQKLHITPKEHRCPNGFQWMVFDKTRLSKDESFEKLPDLIVIDGGKGQLSQAIKATEHYNLKIPLLAIAEKNEEIFIPDEKQPLHLSDHDTSRLIIQHLRDEAHRFAIEYNRKLRKKDYTISALETLPGIGKKRTALLLKTFGSLERIKTLPIDKLAEVVGKKAAQLIKNTFN